MILEDKPVSYITQLLTNIHTQIAIVDYIIASGKSSYLIKNINNCSNNDFLKKIKYIRATQYSLEKSNTVFMIIRSIL